MNMDKALTEGEKRLVDYLEDPSCKHTEGARMTVRFGIIGCGVIGRYHAQAAADSTDIELLAVADLRPGVAPDPLRSCQSGWSSP